MPCTTTNSTRQHHSALSRVRGWRPLAKASAAVGAAAAVTAGVTLSMLAGGAASAATKPAWFMTAGNVQSLSQTDSATASHFFNTSSAYGAGASLVKTPGAGRLRHHPGAELHLVCPRPTAPPTR